MLAKPMTFLTTDNQKLFDCEQLCAQINQDCDLSLDSRKIKPGDTFVAIPGIQEHGLAYARQAIEHGASAVIYDPEEGGHALAQDLAGDQSISVSLMEQPHLSANIGLLASSFYNHPSQHMQVIGITGTNGKTSCSHFIAQALSAISKQSSEYRQCGYIGTLGWGLLDGNQATTNTTPDAIELHRILTRIHHQGAATVAMEVSSHGLVQNRLQGVKIAGAVFTNLGRDHLDYHHSMQNYLNAKLTLFRSPGLDFAVINQDDPVSKRVIEVLDTDVRVIGYSLESTHHLRADQLTIHDIQRSQNNTTVNICFRGQQASVILPLISDFNIANSLATIGVMLGLGVDFSVAVKALGNLNPVPGRMEKVSIEEDCFAVYVDYAHTPDALNLALNSIHNHCSGNISLVFGCGGNRDQGKRKQMGEVASKLADNIILTDDNPRYEDGEQIIRQIVSGCGEKPTQVIRDRELAIQTAILSARAGDIVLIAGKGHEATQEINGKTVACDDRQMAKSALSQYRLQNDLNQSTSTEQ